jgi:type II secretory pathway pseudopilin PulG
MVVKLSFRNRAAFTVVEATIALALIAVLAVIVAQSLVWSLRERARVATHQAALELAANILEAARAQPWERLDQTWADSQTTIPAEIAPLLPDGTIVVTLETGKPLSATRRITVEVRWHFEPNLPAHTVSLTSVLSAREAKKGGTP